MTTYGYARSLSTATKPSIAEQQSRLLSFGASAEHIVAETGSDRQKIGPALRSLVDSMKGGDVLAVTSIDRLGGDLRQVVALISDITAREIDLITMDELGRLNTLGPDRSGIIKTFSTLKHFDDLMVLEGKRYGAYEANKRGHRGGRSKKMDKAKILKAAKAMSAPETNVKELCLSLGIVRQTLYRFVGPDGELRPAALKVVGNLNG